MTRLLAFLCFSILMTDCLRGQDAIELPRFAETTIQSTVHVPDGGRHFFRFPFSSSISRTAREILTPRVEDQCCSRRVIDGITTYDIIHDNKPLTIEFHLNGNIEITVVRTFAPNDVEALRTDFPDLAMHFSDFPTTASPDSRVRLSLEIETTHSFTDLSELEQKRPDLHRILRRFAHASDTSRSD